MNNGGEYLAAAESARGAGSASENGPRIVVLNNLDDVRRWLEVEEATPLSQLKGFQLISVAEAMALRQDDPELGAIVDRAASLGLPLLECERAEIDPIVRDMLPAPVQRRLSALPLTTNGPLLAVLVSDPETTGAIEFLVARRVVPILARPNLIRLGLSSQFDKSEDEAMVRRLGLDPRLASAEMHQKEAERLSVEQPVVKVVADLIDAAIQRRASDIHLRPGPETFEMLYRIDGDLVPVRRFLRILLPAFVSRIKVIGGMNLAEHRVPQDGRASATSGSIASKIKTHHNRVDRIMELKEEGKVLEPLAELFKDEVRALGASLGIPHRALWRHPFPGPGLAVRIPGEITPERVAITQQADAIFIAELRRSGWYEQTWQAYAALLPVKTVGVKGDERSYEQAISLRAVISEDAMTAEWVRLPYEVLANTSNQILNRVKGVNRVLYDISTKPPASIEWE